MDIDAQCREILTTGFCVLKKLLPEEVVQACARSFAPLLQAHVARSDAAPNRGPARHFVPLPFEAPFADPILYENGYEERYRELLSEIFRRLPVHSVHSVTLGPFRMPKSFFRNVVRLYPEEPLFAGPFVDRTTMISYAESREKEMMTFCRDELLQYMPVEKLFSCSPESPISETETGNG